MGKTQYYTATTVDGFIADENNSLEWLFQVESGGENAGFGAFFADVGAMAMGATTYQWVLDHEDLVGSPDKWRGYYGDTPAWVFTHRSLPVIPGVDIRFVQDEIAPVHAAMADAAGDRNIWVVGGGDLAGQFVDAGLLDEVILG